MSDDSYLLSISRGVDEIAESLDDLVILLSRKEQSPSVLEIISADRDGVATAIEEILNNDDANLMNKHIALRKLAEDLHQKAGGQV